MAIAQETSYRDDPNDRSDVSPESEEVPYTPASSFFKLPIKILTIFISFFSATTFGLAIASYILLNVTEVTNTWYAKDAIGDLAICLGVNFLITAPAIFYQLPVIIHAGMDIAMSTVLLVFAPKLLGDGWPSSRFCSRGHYVNEDVVDYYKNTYQQSRWEELPETGKCQKSRNDLRIMMGVTGGVGILIAVLILVNLVLRVVAMTRTKFWEQASFWEANRLPGQIALPTKKSNVTVSWRPAYKVQFSMTFLKQGEKEVEAPKAAEPTPVENTKAQDSADQDAKTATLI